MRLPLAQRELTRLARSRQVHASRGLLIGAIAGMLLVEYASHLTPSGRSFIYTPEYIGIQLYTWCVLAQAAILFVVLPVLAAPTIASERGQHMLPLLMLADFRGWDILAAKALTIMLEAGFLLLALAPIQFMSTVFGGVSPAMIGAQTLVLIALVFFGMMSSMLCSCLVRNMTAAIFAGIFLNLVVLVGLYVADAAFLGGRIGFEAARDLFFEIDTPVRSYGRSIVILAVLAIACGKAILRLLPRIVCDPPRRYWVGAPTPYGHTSRRMMRWGSVWPMLSIHATGMTSTLRSNGVRLVVAALLAGVGAVPVIGTLIVVMLLIHEITSSLVAARRTGALDDLRVTTIAPGVLARDVFAFYWRRGLLYVPALMVAAVHLGVFADSVRFGPTEVSRDWMAAGAGVAAAYSAIFAMTIVALGFAQLFAIVGVSSLAGIHGDNTRRQSSIAVGLLGLAYALCAYAAQCQDHLAKYWKFDDVWFRVPLFLAFCFGVFVVLGLSFRAELRAFFHAGWVRHPMRLHWPAILRPGTSRR